MELTELGIIKDMLVEQDNTGTQSDPDTDFILVLFPFESFNLGVAYPT